jgi:SAM-dependent methyltransferase
VDKKTFYQRVDVAAQYDTWRFGSFGGRYVDTEETGAVIGLLKGFPKDGAILDMPCGTGRLLQALREAGFTDLHGADASAAMLKQSGLKLDSVPLTETDAFQSAFPNAAFDAVCSLRFLFHVPEASRLFQEVHRILRPGGWFVFDSIRWTPRGFLPPVDRRLGGRLYCHGERQLVAMLESHGFAVALIRRKFLLPSLLYRFLPAPLARLVAWAERWLPRTTCTKTFVLAKRMG